MYFTPTLSSEGITDTGSKIGAFKVFYETESNYLYSHPCDSNEEYFATKKAMYTTKDIECHTTPVIRFFFFFIPVNKAFDIGLITEKQILNSDLDITIHKKSYVDGYMKGDPLYEKAGFTIGDYDIYYYVYPYGSCETEGYQQYNELGEKSYYIKNIEIRDGCWSKLKIKNDDNFYYLDNRYHSNLNLELEDILASEDNITLMVRFNNLINEIDYDITPNMDVTVERNNGLSWDSIETTSRLEFELSSYEIPELNYYDDGSLLPGDLTGYYRVTIHEENSDDIFILYYLNNVYYIEVDNIIYQGFTRGYGETDNWYNKTDLQEYLDELE
jgi:hypothetical protein